MVPDWAYDRFGQARLLAIQDVKMDPGDVTRYEFFNLICRPPNPRFRCGHRIILCFLEAVLQCFRQAGPAQCGDAADLGNGYWRQDPGENRMVDPRISAPSYVVEIALILVYFGDQAVVRVQSIQLFIKSPHCCQVQNNEGFVFNVFTSWS